MSIISDVKTYELYDYEGRPSIEINLSLSSGSWGRSYIVSHDDADREKTSHHIKNQILPAIKNKKIDEQVIFDEHLIDLDGTRCQSHFGQNVVRAFSLARARAYIWEHHIHLYRYLGGCGRVHLPVPLIEFYNASEPSQKNEESFSILPVGAANFSQAIKWVRDFIHHFEHQYHSKHTEYDQKNFSSHIADICEKLNLDMRRDVVFVKQQKTITTQTSKCAVQSHQWHEDQNSPFIQLTLPPHEKEPSVSYVYPQHIATLSQMIDLTHQAQKENSNIVLDTEASNGFDSFYGDLCVATNCPIIKLAMPDTIQHIQICNRLLKIEKKQHRHATFSGQSVLSSSFYR